MTISNLCRNRQKSCVTLRHTSWNTYKLLVLQSWKPQKKYKAFSRWKITFNTANIQKWLSHWFFWIKEFPAFKKNKYIPSQNTYSNKCHILHIFVVNLPTKKWKWRNYSWAWNLQHSKILFTFRALNLNIDYMLNHYLSFIGSISMHWQDLTPRMLYFHLKNSIASSVKHINISTCTRFQYKYFSSSDILKAPMLFYIVQKCRCY